MKIIKTKTGECPVLIEDSIIRTEDYYPLVHKYYYDVRWDYTPVNDDRITFQENVLNVAVRYAHFNHIESFDINDWFFDYIKDWKDYHIGQFFRPIIIDKPWNQVLVDRCHDKEYHRPTHTTMSDRWYLHPSELTERRNQWTAQEKVREEAEWQADVERRLRQRDKQRAYRARKKAEKLAKNGK